MNRQTEPLTASHLDQLRRDAKRLARDNGISHSQALDGLARERGFQNWSLLAKNLRASDVPAKGARFLPATVQDVHAALGLPRMDASRDEVLLIAKIVDRVSSIVGNDIPLDRMSLMMDIEACHCNGCPLDLVSLHEAARDYDLIHDVMGIRRHLNRETGQLEDLFRPRYATRDVAVQATQR